MQGKRKERFLKRLYNATIGKIGTLNLILIIVFIFFVWFTLQMLELFRNYGSIPETFACAVVGALIGEVGICGRIRNEKNRIQERKWQKEDQKKEKENEEDNQL